MIAADVMTRDLVSIRRDAPIEEALRLMLGRGISGLPVVDGAGAVVGILSEGDLLRRRETRTERHRPRWLELLLGPGRLAEEYVRTHGRKVEEIMTPDVVTVAEDTTLEEIVALMERHRIKRVPVLRDGLPVGIVSRANLLRALAVLLEDAPAASGNDAAIRERVLAELAQAPWAPRDGIRVAVHDGVVELNGAITDEKWREALRVAAENVSGVNAVRDHLVWVEPVSGMVVDAPDEPERR